MNPLKKILEEELGPVVFDDTIEIIVKRIEGLEFSSWVCFQANERERLEVGQPITAETGTLFDFQCVDCMQWYKMKSEQFDGYIASLTLSSGKGILIPCASMDGIRAIAQKIQGKDA